MLEMFSAWACITTKTASFTVLQVVYGFSCMQCRDVDKGRDCKLLPPLFGGVSQFRVGLSIGVSCKLVHGRDRIKNLNCYSLLALSTHKM